MPAGLRSLDPDVLRLTAGLLNNASVARFQAVSKSVAAATRGIARSRVEKHAQETTKLLHKALKAACVLGSGQVRLGTQVKNGPNRARYITNAYYVSDHPHHNTPGRPRSYNAAYAHDKNGLQVQVMIISHPWHEVNIEVSFKDRPLRPKSGKASFRVFLTNRGAIKGVGYENTVRSPAPREGAHREGVREALDEFYSFLTRHRGQRVADMCVSNRGAQ